MEGRTGREKKVVQIELLIPDEMEQVVILDASANINMLNAVDNSLESYTPKYQRDHSDVRLYYLKAHSSRDKLEKNAGSGTIPTTLNQTVSEIIGVINKKKMAENDKKILIGTYKQRNDNSINTKVAN